MKLSVVIPTYNRKGSLPGCLSAYAKQDFSPNDFEVILVDDGSTDGTGEAVESLRKDFPFPIQYLKKENGGQGSARNQGFRSVSGEIVLISGDDIFPDERMLAEHWDWHSTRYRDENVAVLGFVTWAQSPPPSPFMRWLENGYQNAYPLLRHNMEAGWRFSYTGNLSLKTRFLETSGERFDERLRSYGYEDIEWGFRLAKKGMKIIYNQRAIGYHHHWVTLDHSLQRMEKAGASLRQLETVNPELFAIISSEILPSSRWQRNALKILALPFFSENIFIPVARYFENRLIVSTVFSIAHQYFIAKGKTLNK